MSIETIILEEARLIILRELKGQPNRSLTSTAMRKCLLDQFLIDKPREWVEAQFRYLAELGAVRVTDAGTVKIATILQAGLDHLALKIFIAGVLSPTEPV